MDEMSALRILGLWYGKNTLYDIDEAYKKRSEELSPKTHKDSKIYKQRKEMQRIVDLAKKFLYGEYKGKSKINYYDRWLGLIHETGLIYEVPKDAPKPIEIVFDKIEVGTNEDEVKPIVDHHSETDEETLIRLKNLVHDLIDEKRSIEELSKEELVELETAIKFTIVSTKFDEHVTGVLTNLFQKVLKMQGKDTSSFDIPDIKGLL